MRDESHDQEFLEKTGLDARSFQRGYWFAELVHKALGTNIDLKAEADLMIDVANGDVSLMSSPLETILDIEREFNKPLPESLRQSVHKMVGGQRKSNDDFNRLAANVIVLLMRGQ